MRASIGIPHAVYFDENNEDARLHKLLSHSSPGSWVSFTVSATTASCCCSGVQRPRPRLLLPVRQDHGKADLLFSSMERHRSGADGGAAPISFRTRDGHMLHGFLTMPRHPAGARLPLVLMPHGGPHGVADDWFFDTDAQFLASRGYAVLQVNFRGSDGRGPTSSQPVTANGAARSRTTWSTACAGRSPRARSTARICVYGASFGGYSALMLAAREPDMFKCAVGYAGVYDLNLLAATDEAKSSKRLLATQALVGTDKAELDRFSP
jgi:dipeptidyl aminopeptidase/acylaminoacyl peptidase